MSVFFISKDFKVVHSMSGILVYRNGGKSPHHSIILINLVYSDVINRVIAHIKHISAMNPNK